MPNERRNMSLRENYAADDFCRRYLPFLPEVMRLPRDPRHPDICIEFVRFFENFRVC